MDADGFARWVAATRWTAARTVPDEAAHEYAVITDRGLWARVAAYIARNGYRAEWTIPGSGACGTYTYHEADGWRFWVTANMANRARVDAPGVSLVRVESPQLRLPFEGGSAS